MFSFELLYEKNKPLTVLCLGAHCDDIEIGCGGSILELLRNYPNVTVHWVVFTSTAERRTEAEVSANEFLSSAVKKEIEIMGFRDGFLPYEGAPLKESFEEIKKSIKPDIIFTHYRDDLHQDHRKINELTWNTFRDHLILEYEIIKFDGDLGSPNVFMPLSKDICDKKIGLLLKHYGTQRNKNWFTDETFQAMLRIRGVESNSMHGYAEAFYCRKLKLCCS